MMSRPHSKYIIQRKVLAKHIFLLYLFSPLSKSVATIWCMAAMNKGKECGLTCYVENILHHCTFRDYEGYSISSKGILAHSSRYNGHLS